VTARAELAAVPRVSPIAAATALAATLESIDRQARRAGRTLPTQAERDAAHAAFWVYV
jgi:hypothetical protein